MLKSTLLLENVFLGNFIKMPEKKRREMMVNGKKRGKRRFRGMILLILLEILLLAGIFLFFVIREKSPRSLESQEGNRSYQTKKSQNYQKEMEKKAKIENWKIEADEYGLLELTAQVKFPDYSQVFADNLAEALKNSGNEAEFDEELFRLASEAGEDISFVTHEIKINLSLLDENKTKEDWSEEIIADLLSREAFSREMQDFAMSLVELYMSIDEEQEEETEIEKVTEKGEEHE